MIAMGHRAKIAGAVLCAATNVLASPRRADEPRDPGVYVRVGAGAGVYVGPRNETSGSFFASTKPVAGLAFPFEAAVGGAVANNLVLGLGAYGAAVPVLERKADPRVVGLIGPVLDHYWGSFDGVHAQIALGVGTTIEERSKIDKLRASPAAAAGLGYEWRTGSRWNVGGMLGIRTLIHEKPTFVPGLLFTATLL